MGVSRHKGEYKTSEQTREYKRIKKIRAVNLAIAHYSHGTNRCAICGEHRREFLTLDHINADKKVWNKTHGISEKAAGANLAQALRVRNYPKGIQVLCYNCNVVKGSHITSKGKNTKDRSHIVAGTKVCKLCRQEKSVDDFALRSKYLQSLCKVCDGIRQVDLRLDTKQKLIALFGGKCSCCGESRLEYLSVEHSNNDGPEHRTGIKQRYNLKAPIKQITGSTFYFYVLKDIAQGIIWPGLEIHCHNCNCSKGNHGYCPHEIERGVIIFDPYGKPLKALKEVYV
jgi:hypothetical protein